MSLTALLGAVANQAGVPPEDFQAILSTAVGSDSSSVTLTSAGSAEAWTSFQDLLLISSVRVTTSGTSGGVEARLNADSSSYSTQYLYSNASSGTGARDNPTGARIDYATRSTAAADEFGCSVAVFGDINSSRYKTVQTMGGADVNGAGEVGQLVTIWRDTDAVTSIEIRDAGGNNIAADSRFDLYGLRTA